MSKKPRKKTLKAKCDKLWSEIVRSRGRCERCGGTSNLQAAHIESRRFVSTRHDLDNGICLCAGCHHRAHNRPTEFTLWLVDYKGREFLEELHSRNEPTYGKFDYEVTYEKLRKLSSGG